MAKPLPLSEVARRLGVSRQRVWQMRKLAKGQCKLCSAPLETAEYCAAHQDVKNAAQNARNAARRRMR